MFTRKILVALTLTLIIAILLTACNRFFSICIRYSQDRIGGSHSDTSIWRDLKNTFSNRPHLSYRLASGSHRCIDTIGQALPRPPG